MPPEYLFLMLPHAVTLRRNEMLGHVQSVDDNVIVPIDSYEPNPHPELKALSTHLVSDDRVLGRIFPCHRQ